MLILCCGNADRGDDGAGPACADALRMLHAPAKCLPGDAFSLLEAWTGQAKVILVDAILTGAAPGTLHRFEIRNGENVDQFEKSLGSSSHGFGIAEAGDYWIPVVCTPGTTPLSVQASYPGGYDPAAPYEIVFEGDTDGDHVMERLSGTIVTAAYDSAVTVAAPIAPQSLEDARLVTAPNPFIGGTRVAFALARADAVDLGVYDLSGRLVRSLQSGMLAAGAHRFEWNGRDDRGRRSAAGVYFVRMSASGRVIEAKVVKVQ